MLPVGTVTVRVRHRVLCMIFGRAVRVTVCVTVWTCAGLAREAARQDAPDDEHDHARGHGGRRHAGSVPGIEVTAVAK